MNKFISSLIAVFSVAALHGQNAANETPKLVIGITIDQLRGDYLRFFAPNFGENGFKRLMKEGLVYDNVSYNFPHPDKASATATIYTGATPFYHGIVAEKKYDARTANELAAFADKNYVGNSTSEQLSPLPMLVSTITDELKIASNGQSDVFALAPHASQALAAGGHAANAGYWIEDFSGKWVTTSFYKNTLPIINLQ